MDHTLDIAGSLEELVGDTPMLRLDRVTAGLTCTVLAKLEYLNPGGSVKDRVAVAMLDVAEQAGLLQPGGTIVEGTSGNTGVGLAMAAARRGYRCVFAMSDKQSREKVSLLQAYGAEVVVCPTAVPPEHPDSYYSVVARLAAEIPGAFRPDQYSNPANPEVHERTTGPEIWRQTDGRVTHFVAGVGTGGTVTGVSRALKARNPAVVIVGADPVGSVFSGGDARPYLVEGIGEDFWPSTFDPTAVDRIVTVSDRDSFLTARHVTREEGLLVGGSGGTAVYAALEVGRDLGPDDVVVVLIPDGGRQYLSKLYDDDWMADNGFLDEEGPTIAELLHAKERGSEGALPALVHVHPDETVREAIQILREFGVSQMPVVKAEPPVMSAEVAGSVGELELMERAFAEPAVLDRPVSEVMGPPLPVVGGGERVGTAVRRLGQAPAVLVMEGGHPVGILSRSDVLGWVLGLPHR